MRPRITLGVALEVRGFEAQAKVTRQFWPDELPSATALERRVALVVRDFERDAQRASRRGSARKPGAHRCSHVLGAGAPGATHGPDGILHGPGERGYLCTRRVPDPLAHHAPAPRPDGRGALLLPPTDVSRAQSVVRLKLADKDPEDGAAGEHDISACGVDRIVGLVGRHLVETAQVRQHDPYGVLGRQDVGPVADVDRSQRCQIAAIEAGAQVRDPRGDLQIRQPLPDQGNDLTLTLGECLGEPIAYLPTRVHDGHRRSLSTHRQEGQPRDHRSSQRSHHPRILS